MRSTGDAAPLTTCTVVTVLVTNVASVVFARCLVMVEQLFGLEFANVLGAPEALVFYFKWFGRQPDGKYHSSVRVQLGDRPVAGTIKGGHKS